MFKSLGIMISGIFIGALAMEVIRRTCPKALDAAYARTREIASRAREAFEKGYESAASPQKAPDPIA